MNRPTKVMIGLGVLLLVGVILVRCGGSNDTANPRTPSPATPTETATPSAVPTPDKPKAFKPKDVAEVTQAAGSAVSLLSTAVLLPDRAVEELVAQYVVPSQQESFIVASSQSVEWFLATTGYDSIDQARVQAAYYVDPQMYRVNDITTSKASVSLYVITSWVTEDKLMYKVPNIITVNLEKHGNRWLYSQSEVATGDEAPTPHENLTFEQTAAQFEPYLKGYSDYAFDVAGPA